MLQGILSRIFKGKASVQPGEKMYMFRLISSQEKGRFGIYVGEKALSLLEKDGHVKFEDIERLPARIYDKCRALGLCHSESYCFTLDVSEKPHPTLDTYAGITKIVPPMPMPNGDIATRSLAVFRNSYAEEMAKIDNTIIDIHRHTGVAMNEKNLQKLNEAAIPVKRVKTLMCLSHEMVHLFATDDFTDHFRHLDMDMLEQLTDAVNFLTFYEAYKNQSYWVKYGFADSVAYLVNQLQKEGVALESQTILKKLNKKANAVISDCQERGRNA